MYVVLADPRAYTTHLKHAARIMKTIEEVYDDYLYDCHIANKRLTPEEWQFYGREEHHIEIPNRDGGVLTPLNSQHLTTHQHWVAGVLQSEVLQKCCFAYVPRGALSGPINDLRLKWAKISSQEGIHNPKNDIIRRDALLKGVETQKVNQLGIYAPHLRQPRHPSGEYADKIPYHLREVTEFSKHMSQKIGKKVIITTPQGQTHEYESIKLACRVYGLHPGHLREVCQGKRNHHKGFTARYAD